MGNSDRSSQTELQRLAPEFIVPSESVIDPNILRIRRMGKRLFGVASCVVTFGESGGSSIESDYSLTAIEEAFCLSIPQTTALLVASDTHSDPLLNQHRLVIGAPFIRFFVSCPIYNNDQIVIGSINLIDYGPRLFSDEDRQSLSDLASLVERELHLRMLSVTQLDLQKKNKTLRRKSLIDPMIGTWNRGAIMRILAIETTRCDKVGVPLSLIVVDLDYFKKVNDTYGHPAGDTVLVKVASRLRSCIRPQEALGRYGGEEFLVVLPGSSHETAMSVAERMRAAIASQEEIIGDKVLRLTISAGVASTDLFPLATTDELINYADVALYAAKDGGRNCVVQAKVKTP